MEEVDLDQTVRLYRPHDGRRCCGMSIPKSVAQAAQELNGQRMTLRQAVSAIEASAPLGRVYPIPEHGYLCLHVGDYRQGEPEHFFAVIHYR